MCFFGYQSIWKIKPADSLQFELKFNFFVDVSEPFFQKKKVPAVCNCPINPLPSACLPCYRQIILIPMC